MNSSYVPGFPMKVGTVIRVAWGNAVISMKRMGWWVGTIFVGALVAGCTDGGTRGVLMADAEFDPALASDLNIGINEMTPGVAQTFTVLADGKFEEFWIVITDGESVDDGVVEITVRPVVGGVPDPDPDSSIIDPISVDSTTLPATLVEEYTEYFVGDDSGEIRQTLMGEEYAIVIEFVSRTGVDTAPIVRVLGRMGDEYVDGNGAVDDGTGYVATTDDYIFRTFSLQK
jgi:hypothetical protein